MRVITGTARGARLSAPEGLDVRPTTDKVKESVFNIVQFDVPNARVLDLFAGSGQMGIEALSRGARSCVFLDNSKQSLRFVIDNLKKTGFSEKSAVKQADSLAYLRTTGETFDLAFLDPPYHKQLVTTALPLLAPHMSPYGVAVCETALDEELPESAGQLKRYREYRYGKVKLTVYKVPEEEECTE